MKIILPPILIVLVVVVIGLVCVWTQEAWLAPSIAAAAFTQMFLPSETGAKPYGIFAGQAIGVAAGFAGVYAAHATETAKFIGSHDLSYDRAVAIFIAVAIAALVQSVAQAKSPAGGATALVVAIGSETPNVSGVFRLAVGIAMVTLLGEIARRLMLSVLGERAEA